MSTTDSATSDSAADTAGHQPGSHPFWTAPRPSQQARYQRILEATIELAAEQGYDGVQMRSVAVRSGVSIGTVYTYFQSRDNLLYRATVAYNHRVAEKGALQRVSDGEHGLETFEDDIVASLQNYLEEPRVLDAYIRSTLTLDPEVVALRKEITWDWWREMHPQLELLGPENAEIAPRLLTDAFYTSALRWAFGQIELQDVIEQVREVVRLLIRAAPH